MGSHGIRKKGEEEGGLYRYRSQRGFGGHHEGVTLSVRGIRGEKRGIIPKGDHGRRRRVFGGRSAKKGKRDDDCIEIFKRNANGFKSSQRRKGGVVTYFTNQPGKSE